MNPARRTCHAPSRRGWLACVVAVSVILAGLGGGRAFAGDLEGPALLAALRAGGHVLYFRHTSTDFGQNDEGMRTYDDCTKQRNLTDRGRAEARAIGADIAALQVPIGAVLASPYCRTMETARLMFGRAAATPAVRGGPASDADGRYAALRELLATAPPAGTNVAIVSHGNPFRALVDAPYLAEGEAAVIAPGGGAAFRVVARVPREGWARLAP